MNVAGRNLTQLTKAIAIQEWQEMFSGEICRTH